MINKKVSFLKIRDVKSPKRANQHDAGTDFFMPEYTPEFFEVLTKANFNNKIKYSIIFDTELNKEVLEVIIPSGEQVNIPSGIKVWIHDKTTYLKATNKSGIAAKKHLDVMAKKCILIYVIMEMKILYCVQVIRLFNLFIWNIYQLNGKKKQKKSIQHMEQLTVEQVVLVQQD